MSRREITTQLMAARKKAFRDQNGRCFWCDREMTKRPGAKRSWPLSGRWPPPRNFATADHLILSSDGGRDDETNIVAACYDCNHNRRNLRVSEWMAIVVRTAPAAHVAVILQRLARFGIKLSIGTPLLRPPTIEESDCPRP